MKHTINANELGDMGLPIVDAIQKCVHCGFCLPTCPTYQIQGQEMDSPRGRILLMKEVLEGTLDSKEASPYIDRCLGCQACETACPSGVPYGSLHSAYLSATRPLASSTLAEKAKNVFVHQTIPYPARFRLAARIGKLLTPLHNFAPKFLRNMLALIPKTIPAKNNPPEFSGATSERIGQVGLLAGCAQQVLAPEINLATIRVLNSIGFDVLTPHRQTCCGALDWHEGRMEQARKLAAKNVQAFGGGLDAIITNSAGCGSAINEYGLLFQGSQLQQRAKQFANGVVDISTFLDQQNLPQLRLPKPTKIAYHDACHLAHAQGIRQAPRKLLARIGNAELVPLEHSEHCCGSAGTYNINQPKIAASLGRQKANAVVESGCEVLVAGNIGCLVQIKTHVADQPIEILHTIEIIDRALRNK